MNAEQGAQRPVVAAFDVDGTLTTKDCVVPFLELLVGRRRLIAGCARHPLQVAGAALRRDRDRFKAISAHAAFAGREPADVDRLGETFAKTVAATLLRPDTTRRLNWHLRQQHVVVLVSASFANYLRPLGAILGASDVLCTEAAIGADGLYTGALVGANCRGPEKERRLRAWLRVKSLDDAEIWAYGDSAGDKELLLAAHHRANVRNQVIGEVPEPAA